MIVKILIADDHQMIRKGLKTALSEVPNFEVCGEAANGLEAIAQTKSIKPDVIVLDLNMPVLGGFQAAEQILQESPDAKVLFYTSHQSAYFANEARRIGARGFINKGSSCDSLITAVRALARGESYFENSSSSGA